MLSSAGHTKQRKTFSGFGSALYGLLHQVRILAELFERTSTAKYSGLQCIFHLPERTDFLPLVWQKLPKGTEHVYSSVRTG